MPRYDEQHCIYAALQMLRHPALAQTLQLASRVFVGHRPVCAYHLTTLVSHTLQDLIGLGLGEPSLSGPSLSGNKVRA